MPIEHTLLVTSTQDSLQEGQPWCPSQALPWKRSHQEPAWQSQVVQEGWWRNSAGISRCGRHLLPHARGWVVPGAAPGAPVPRVTPGDLCTPGPRGSATRGRSGGSWEVGWESIQGFLVALQHCGDIPHSSSRLQFPALDGKRVFPSVRNQLLSDSFSGPARMRGKMKIC